MRDAQMSLLDPPSPPRARRSDPPTSQAAALAVGARLWEDQRCVLALLRHHGPMTDVALVAQAAVDGVRMSPSGLRTRRRELVTKGLVVADGTVRIGRREHLRWRAV